MSTATVHIGRIDRTASCGDRVAACSCGWCSPVRRPALATGCPDAAAAEQDWLDHVAAQPGAERLRTTRARRDDGSEGGRYPLAGVSITRTGPGEGPTCSRPAP